jgi:hypothetical protein
MIEPRASGSGFLDRGDEAPRHGIGSGNISSGNGHPARQSVGLASESPTDEVGALVPLFISSSRLRSVFLATRRRAMAPGRKTHDPGRLPARVPLCSRCPTPASRRR